MKKIFGLLFLLIATFFFQASTCFCMNNSDKIYFTDGNLDEPLDEEENLLNELDPLNGSNVETFDVLYNHNKNLNKRKNASLLKEKFISEIDDLVYECNNVETIYRENNCDLTEVYKLFNKKIWSFLTSEITKRMFKIFTNTQYHIYELEKSISKNEDSYKPNFYLIQKQLKYIKLKLNYKPAVEKLITEIDLLIIKVSNVSAYESAVKNPLATKKYLAQLKTPFGIRKPDVYKKELFEKLLFFLSLNCEETLNANGTKKSFNPLIKLIEKQKTEDVITKLKEVNDYLKNTYLKVKRLSDK
jgi:hypothetical protein